MCLQQGRSAAEGTERKGGRARRRDKLVVGVKVRKGKFVHGGWDGMDGTGQDEIGIWGCLTKVRTAKVPPGKM